MIELTYEGGVYGLCNNENEYYWIGVKSAPGRSFPTPNVHVPIASYNVLYKAAMEQGHDEKRLLRKKKMKKVRITSSRTPNANPNAISIF